MLCTRTLAHKKHNKLRNPFSVKYVCVLRNIQRTIYAARRTHTDSEPNQFDRICNLLIGWQSRASIFVALPNRTFCMASMSRRDQYAYMCSTEQWNSNYTSVICHTSHLASAGDLNRWIRSWTKANLHGCSTNVECCWIHLTWISVRAMLIGIELINNWLYSRLFPLLLLLLAQQQRWAMSTDDKETFNSVFFSFEPFPFSVMNLWLNFIATHNCCLKEFTFRLLTLTMHSNRIENSDYSWQ